MAITKEDVLEFISNLSVLELSELVKEFEEKFGVSAAPVMVAGGAVAAGGAAAAEEKTEFNIVLVDSVIRKSTLLRLLEHLQVLVLKRLKTQLKELHLFLKKALAKTKLKQLKKSLKRLVLRLNLNNFLLFRLNISRESRGSLFFKF